MTVCSAFVDTVECTLTLTNSYNIKFTVLTLLLIYSIVALYFSNNIDKEASYMHYWAYWFSKVVSYIYIGFSALFYLLLLNQNISIGVFITIIAGFYLLFVAVIIGVIVYQGASRTFQIFGFDDWNVMKDSMNEKKSKRKYG